ncbi:MAG: transposase [Rhodobacteraceae bacterium]|nr:transposase [Paracoccaceae bacterium]
MTALISLRGLHILSAVTIRAALGDITRFTTPRQLMSFLGLVPSERASGPKRRTGGITKTGNGPVRRIRVEAAWNTRFPARKTRHLQAKAARGTGSGASHRLACPEATLRTHQPSQCCAQASRQGHHSRGPGARRLHRGHRLRGQRPPAWQSGPGLRNAEANPDRARMQAERKETPRSTSAAQSSTCDPRS